MIDKRVTVLAVDDNPDNLVTIKALIRESFPNANVLTALSGQRGLDLAIEHDPDVILLDIVMPGMSGFEVCRSLKSNNLYSDIPIVFITALKGDKDSRIKALECGAEAFLAKPIDEYELIAQIRAMVKIKSANLAKRDEKQRLTMLVEERTQQLKQEHVKALSLVKALEEENAIRKQSEAALREAKDYFELVFNTSPDAAYIARLDDGVILNANEGFTNLFGYSKDSTLGKDGMELTLFQKLSDRAVIERKLMEDGYIDAVEVDLMRADGSSFIGLLSAKLIVLEGKAHVSTNVHNITERKKMEDNLYYLSHHDFLTGLNNRRFFEQKLKTLDSPDLLPLSIISGDINGVKLINDAFGHEKGDRLIVETAKAMQGCCREGDILARTGGDEFVLLMPKTDAPTALAVLQAIQLVCEQINQRSSKETFHISIALGSGTKTDPDQPIETVLRIAEKYMYQRKVLESKSMHSAVLTSIRATLFEKNEETEEHCERLIMLSKMVGRRLNLSQKELDELELLSTLHDIGKIGIPEQILNKPGKLTDEEWIEMKKHPQIGYRIANASLELAPIAEYILCHHERWDGMGYPQKLKERQIPLLSRIISIVDAYDAMTQDRAYRKKMDSAEAVIEIRNNAGTQFDPEIASIFLDELAVNQVNAG
ncbi:MAG: diguanylate cyclase [Clostridiales bacterium]|nr:diguanylate cyclase [Clostridiales bacterium]